MFLSFIVPVYNGETYLAECLDSLLRQGISAKEYEVLAIDDGSTDKTGEILETYCGLNANVRRFSQNHLGVSAARNRGIQEAQGDYVWFVDADDFIQDNALIELQKIIQTDFYDRIIFDVYSFFEALTADETEAKNTGTICSNSGSNTVAVWASIFRRDFLIENRKFFREGLTMSEDALFLYELQLIHPVSESLNQVLYFWRRNSASTTMSESKVTVLQKMDSILQVAIQMDHYYHSRQGEMPVCANYLMSNLWLFLHYTAGLDHKNCRVALRKAIENDLFPYHRPPECTLRKTYMTTRTDYIGKIFDFVGTHLHRRWGFALMRLYCMFQRQVIAICK